IDPSGNPVVSSLLPVSEADRAVADGDRPYTYHDVRVSGTHLRVYTVPVTVVGAPGVSAAQLASPLDPVDKALKLLALRLVLLSLAGVAVAGGLGLLVARAALVPVDRLTADAERVAETMDLSSSIQVEGA